MTKRVSLDRLRDISKQRAIRRPLVAARGDPWVRWLTSRTPSNGRSRANPDAVEPLRKHLAHYPLVDP